MASPLSSPDVSSRAATGEPANPASQRRVDSLTRDRAAWGLLVAATLVMAAIWFVLAGDYAWDDAFISFRYSRNLANGDGLVWNPGGEHTQGYTNFLFVVLVAGGMKLGMTPYQAANVLNTAGLIVIVAILGTRVRALLPDQRRAWIVPPLAFLFLPLVPYILLARMETVFWCGLLLAAIWSAQRAVQTARPRYGDASLALFFLATLTRPESVLVAGLVILYLLIRVPASMRARIVVVAAITGVLGLAYLGWTAWYFGDWLPNSFYVKVDQPDALPGLDYVTGLLRYFAVRPATYLGVIGWLVIPRQRWASLVPYLSVLVLAIFYLFVSPLMGFGYRFLFPITCLLDVLITTGLIALIVRLNGVLFRRMRALRGPLRRAGVMVVLAMALAFLGLDFWIGAYSMWLDAQSGDSPQAFGNQRTMGLLLRDVDGIQHVKIAFGDAGRIAYYTDSQFLDVVGLNENTIAREGNERGAAWVIRYVLDQRPDLIGFYTYPDGRVYVHDHGALGAAYYQLYTDPDFQQHYAYAGGFDSFWGVYAQLFVRTDSPYADRLTAAIRSQADVVELGTLHR